MLCRKIVVLAAALAGIAGRAVNVPSGEEVTYDEGDAIADMTVRGTVYIKGGTDGAAQANITVYDGGKVYMSGGALTNQSSSVLVKKGGYFEQTGGTLDLNWFRTEREGEDDGSCQAKILGGTFRTHVRNYNGAFQPNGGASLFRNMTFGDAANSGAGNFAVAGVGNKPYQGLSEDATVVNDVRLENVSFADGVFSPNFTKGTFGCVTAQLTVAGTTFRSAPNAPNAKENFRTSYVLDNSKVCFYYGYSFPYDFATAWEDRTYVPPEGAWHELVITNGADVIMSSKVYEDATCAWWNLSDAEAVSKANYNVYVGTGTLRIEGGRLATGVMMCPGGQLIVNGGKLVASNIGLYNGKATGEECVLSPGCDLFLNGGEVILPTYQSGTPGLGSFVIGDNSTGNQSAHAHFYPMTVRHNGAKVTMPSDNGTITFGRYNSLPGTARWEYRSGMFSDNVCLYTQISNVMEVAKIGSAQSPRLKYINAEATWGAFNKAVCEFVFDNSSAHISPWIFTDAAGRRFGSLRITLDGGVMVTANDTFNLIALEDGTLNSSNKKTYYDVPDPALWTEQLSADAKTSQVKLTPALGAASAAGGEIVLATPQALGSVTMAGVRASGSLVEAHVDLALKDAEGNALSSSALGTLRSAMVAAGYTNSTLLAEGAYNLRVAFPADAFASGDTRFVWDFTRRPGAWALATTADVVTTNACVASVRFSEMRRRTGFSLIVR